MHKHGGPHQGKAAEYEAQLFAASFLMPQSDIEAKIPRALTLDQIKIAKQRWGVSTSALAYRLNKLGILSPWLYRGIVIEIGRRGYRTEEPDEMPREESILWRKVLSDLWASKVSKNHIADDLNIPVGELEKPDLRLGAEQERGCCAGRWSVASKARAMMLDPKH